MTWQPTHAQLESLSTTIAEKMGLRFGPERWRDMARGVEVSGCELGFADMECWVHQLISRPLEQRQVEVLARQLTIGETYFMREKSAFVALKELILPELLQRRRHHSRRLRFWSAACCTGEEAYSIAIALTECIPHLPEWDVSILATDINPVFLDKARRGIYHAWSFRDTLPAIIEKYFEKKEDGGCEVVPEIKRMVRFAYHNLAEAEDVLPQGENDPFDVVFCRNALMYFDAACQKKVIERLHRSLVPGGWFIPGLTEISMAFSPPFEFVKFPEGMFCKKGVKKAQQQTAVAAAVRYEDAASIPPAAGMPPHRSSLKGPAGSPLQAGQWGRSDTSHRDMDAGFLPGDALEKNAETVAQEVNPTAGPDKRLEEARAVFQKKQYDEVVRLLSNPAGNRPAESHVLLARAHANCGRLGEALKAADAATAADKLNAEAYYVRALVLQEQGHVEQAHEALKQTLYLEPDHILAHVNQGQIAGRLGKQALSRKHLRNAIGLLQSLPPDCEVPDSDGLTASQFVGILKKEVFRS